ncbi:MAG: heavy metal translocating P-type ATPase [Syntrophomonadaceae bacterium]|nr:heavy metal translocating P-type ATPase [Syntrophomonadaceae bacterium]
MQATSLEGPAPAPRHPHARQADRVHDDSQQPAGATHPHAAHGPGAHPGHSPAAFRRRFWVSLALTIPVLAYSHHVQAWLGFTPPPVPGHAFIPALFGALVFAYGGTVFLQGAVHELRGRRPGMMTLVALAICVALGYSLLVTAGFPGEELYWELASLVTIMLLGHWLESSAVQAASGALNELARLLPDTAWRLVDGAWQEVPVSVLRPGDIILVRPGAQVPADGLVVSGQSHVVEAMLTGESAPVAKQPGTEVKAGTLNEEGALEVRVQRVGAETALAGIMRLVAEAQQSRSRTQVLADRAAFWLFVIALASAALTAAAWLVAGAGGAFITERVVTVLVAACPHALGLAIPLVVAISTALGARNGLLVRDRLGFENARRVDVVVFDKTGTLTRGQHELVHVHAVPGTVEDDLLRWAAGAEAPAEHMMARAVVRAALSKGLQPAAADEFTAMPGRGVRARVGGRTVEVGGPNLLAEVGGELPPQLQEPLREAEARGETVAFVRVGGVVVGMLNFADRVREESRAAVAALRGRGITVAMLTGDSQAVAASVARELGISRYFAGVLPEQKSARIQELRQEGHVVAMVGDGVNDAPALATADVGVAIGAGTDVAVQTASVVLVRNDPRDVVHMLDLSRATYRKMVQNLAWATGYNAVVIPLAAGVLAPLGFILPMAMAAVVMSASTIIVALNAQGLRRLRLEFR